MSVANRKTGKYKIDLTELKSGTRILVKSRKWYEDNLKSIGMDTMFSVDGHCFTEEMARYCGTVVEVDSPTIVGNAVFVMGEDRNPTGYLWTPGMFECII
jgi:hypothetical protein